MTDSVEQLNRIVPRCQHHKIISIEQNLTTLNILLVKGPVCEKIPYHKIIGKDVDLISTDVNNFDISSSGEHIFKEILYFVQMSLMVMLVS